ncbi:MAG: hypothetical protein WBA12_12245 [Catalinimonas sp.]
MRTLSTTISFVIFTVASAVLFAACDPIEDPEACFTPENITVSVGETVTFNFCGDGDKAVIYTGDTGQVYQSGGATAGGLVDIINQAVPQRYFHTYRDPGTYTVVGEVSTTPKDNPSRVERSIWTTTVTVTPVLGHVSSTMLSYAIDSIDVEGFLNSSATVVYDANFNITATVPFGTDVTSLVPTFRVSDLARVTVGGVEQRSGETPVDFSGGSVTYQVTANDGSVIDQIVTLVVAPPSTNPTVISFSYIPGPGNVVDGDIVGDTIFLIVPPNTRTSAAINFTIPAFTNLTLASNGSPLVPNSVRRPLRFPASGIVEIQASTQDGSVRSYFVKLVELPGFTSYSFEDLDPQIEGVIDYPTKTVTLTVLRGTNLNNVIATFETNSPGAQVTVNGVPQVSGVTPNNFGSPVIYTISADGLNEQYTVIVKEVG